MRLLSPSKPLPIILRRAHELEELDEENARLRRLAVTLKEKVTALRKGDYSPHAR
jgi:hypothetical protein